MPAPRNDFKARLKSGDTQIGPWVAFGDPGVAELCAGSGFDWLVIDAEHGPNGLRDVLAQSRAVSARTHPVVRVWDDNRANIKQTLDARAQTVLVPVIESADQAREVVRSMTDPPKGVRGVDAALARASDCNATGDYLQTANEECCTLLQVESMAGVKALDGFLKVEGVDGIFVGPADLAGDMGYVGQPAAPEVQKGVVETLNQIRSTGHPAGILTSDRGLAERCADLGVEFLAVGSDVSLLRAGLPALRAAF